jgi:hypothetical protein
MKITRRGLLLAGLLLATAGAPDAIAAQPARKMTGMHASAQGSAERTLRESMRKLWTDHVVWTREYVVAAVAGTPDADAAAKRLMKNQEDLGAAIVPFYGKDAGDKLTALLKEHISIAVDLVKAAKTNQQSAFNDANRKWKQNASDIAAFLANANPNWPQAAMVDAMNMHLETTTREVVARLQHKYDEDVAAFDALYEHILHMADVLSDGIVKQFPDRFKA